MTEYIRVVPVCLEPVPAGCEWSFGYGEWFPVHSNEWTPSDCWLAFTGVLYRYPAPPVPDSWLNTLSLD